MGLASTSRASGFCEAEDLGLGFLVEVDLGASDHIIAHEDQEDTSKMAASPRVLRRLLLPLTLIPNVGPSLHDADARP